MRYGLEAFHEKYSNKVAGEKKKKKGEVEKKKTEAKPKQKKQKAVVSETFEIKNEKAAPSKTKKKGGSVTANKISKESPYETLTWEKDSKMLTKEKGNVMKVTETEYIHINRLNDQDLEDINTIKELEKIAKERQKQGITVDEAYLLENDNFLFDEELK